ncbi:Calcium-dependent protein kinase 17 [Camellia lanceoleosa]|uniref:Calcium-dependent protein kinase 17 n=1 Tax=Camellia lanceoleosa TaxID=1840588 RepID=A0ACC0HMN8_9ERIC|nr:Calcium-dependent protein kinase 17 [Camellia lanceoleosa]
MGTTTLLRPPLQMGNCCSRGNKDSDPMNTDNTTSKKEGFANPNPDPNNPETAGATDHPKNNPPSASSNPSSKPSKAASIGPVLGCPMEDVKSIYSVGKELVHFDRRRDRPWKSPPWI